MNAPKRYLRCGGTDERTKDIALCIPWIPLGSQKRVRTASFSHCHSPFEQFVTGTDCHADAHHHKNAPPWARYHPASNQYLSRNYCRNEALGKVAKLVIVISLQSKMIANPIEERNVSVCVVTADQKNTCMYGDQKVSQIGEPEPRVCRHQYRNRDQGWKRFQPPCPAIVGSHPRPHQHNADTNQKTKRPDKLPSLRSLLRNHCSCLYLPLSFMSTVREPNAFHQHRKSYAPKESKSKPADQPHSIRRSVMSASAHHRDIFRLST